MSKWPWPERVKKMVLRLTGPLAGQSLVDRRADRVVGFRRRDDSLGAREGEPGLERLALRHGNGLDQPLMMKLRDQRRVAVVTQAAGVDSRRNEIAPQRVHQHQRRQAGAVARIVGVMPAGERGT